MRRRLLAMALLSALAVPAAALAVSDPAEMLPDPKQESRAEQIGTRLRCLVCQNEDIEDSGANLARDLRHAVRVHVAAGDSDAQIMDWMVKRYGEFIRLQPRLSPFTWLLWGIGPLALLAGVLVSLSAARRQAALSPAPLDPAERQRLEQLLR